MIGLYSPLALLALVISLLLGGCAMDNETRAAMINTGTAMMAGPRYEPPPPVQWIEPQHDTICRPIGGMSGGAYRCN